jgi:hypothetical protein
MSIGEPTDLFREGYRAGWNDAEARHFALLEEPTAYLHEIEEPERGSRQMLSMSADNPWSHWSEENRLRCTYRCTPLYAGTTVETRP